MNLKMGWKPQTLVGECRSEFILCDTCKYVHLPIVKIMPFLPHTTHPMRGRKRLMSECLNHLNDGMLITTFTLSEHYMIPSPTASPRTALGLIYGVQPGNVTMDEEESVSGNGEDVPSAGVYEDDVENIARWIALGFDIQIDGRHWMDTLCSRYCCPSELRSFFDRGSLQDTFHRSSIGYRVPGTPKLHFLLDFRPCGQVGYAHCFHAQLQTDFIRVSQ